MIRVCAWCDTGLDAVSRYNINTDNDVSHGICPECRDQFLEDNKITLAYYLNKVSLISDGIISTAKQKSNIAVN